MTFIETDRQRMMMLARDMEIMEGKRRLYQEGRFTLDILRSCLLPPKELTAALDVVGESQSGVTLMEAARDLLRNPQANVTTLSIVLQALVTHNIPAKRCPVPMLVAELFYLTDDLSHDSENPTTPPEITALLGAFAQRVILEEDTYVTSGRNGWYPNAAFKKQVATAIDTGDCAGLMKTTLNYLETGDHASGTAFATEKEIRQAYYVWCRLGEEYSSDPMLYQYLEKLTPVGKIFNSIFAHYYRGNTSFSQVVDGLSFRSLKTLKSFLNDPPLVRPSICAPSYLMNQAVNRK